MARPPRLRNFDYIGPLAVFFTTVTRNRHRAFLSDHIAQSCLEQILQQAEERDVEILAYCFMPDHAHLLIVGERHDSDIKRVFERWKQNTGYWHRQVTGSYLWQPGYWDRVMRDTDDVFEAVCYIVANPVRAGLVQSLKDFKWIGSSRYSVDELADTYRHYGKPTWW